MYDSGPRLGAGGGPPPAPGLRRYCHMNISSTADLAAVENMMFTTVESFVIAIGICMTMFERSKHQDLFERISHTQPASGDWILRDWSYI